MNDEAFVLTKQEIEVIQLSTRKIIFMSHICTNKIPYLQAFREDKTAKRNLQESYGLMLDFYGIELSNLETGEVRRASHWQERFYNLNR